MTVEVWYHANYLDGFGAAYAAWKLFGDTATYRPVQYGKEPPDVDPVDRLYLVDFSYKFDMLCELAKKHGTIIILDHHKTAKEDLERSDLPPNVRVLFDMKRSGAVIAWEFFHPDEPIPDVLRFIQDRDLWTWDLSGTKEICAALDSYPKAFDVWEKLFDTSLEQLVQEGQAITRYRGQQIQIILDAWTRDPRYITLDGVTGPVVNAPPFIVSELLHELGKDQPFAASFTCISDAVIFSLRSNPDGVDVSEIAARRGGGGRKHAAGFGIEGIQWFSDAILDGLTLNGNS